MRLLNDDHLVVKSRLDRKVHVKLERMFFRVVALACGLTVSACGDAGDAATEDPSALPQAFLAVSPGYGGPAGIVLETMNAERYSYARVGADDEEIWVAGPMTELAVGDTVSLVGAGNMGAFTSPSLDRTFEDLYFIDQFLSAGAADGTFQGTIIETMNAAGYTYAQVNVGEEFGWMAAPGAEEPLIWLAGPETVLSAGDLVSWQGGSVMRGFHSTTLERTFTEIIFVGSFTVMN
jgi:hypothetical protein